MKFRSSSDSVLIGVGFRVQGRSVDRKAQPARKKAVSSYRIWGFIGL